MSSNIFDRPVVLVVMDGVGVSATSKVNAVKDAHLETLDDLWQHYPSTLLHASGHYVGIPDGDAGNSEVGHNALGSGQIIAQGPLRVQQAFDHGSPFQTETWKEAIKNVKDHNSTLHFIGIFSDGNVHSNLNHLFSMMSEAHKSGIEHIRIHPAFDGRDVSPHSAEKYIKMFDDFVASLGSPDYKIADGGGRMIIWADRYENDWGVVENGWDIAVRGEGRKFKDPITAITTLNQEAAPSSDQYIPPFVIVDATDQPIGTIQKGDSVIFFNFRADRAIMTSVAFTYYDFPHFDRGDYSPDDIYYAGLTEYNSDTHVPAHTLIPPFEIQHTLSDLLQANHISQYAISETIKYGHITYYFDGNHYLEQSDLITYEEVPSEENTANIVTRPWMKSAEITDRLVDAIKSNKYRFLRINFPNGDMVGHFANLEPTIIAMEAVDIALKRILEAVDEVGGMAIITADHGNAEELADAEGHPKTAHTTSPVPCIFYDRSASSDFYSLKKGTDFGLANLASTIAILLGLDPLSTWQPPLIQVA
ncbi:2,3-bisphosphoglycerate-independent phosphoglycerate mutase [Christensenellaceae bacterium OttesenSCG-928-L17]|nr:2,3-bisphosphoglycerate-independent phosphoglycerate mutase [Christensenellaceae bacterium OttesenSCG-928-L17]